MAVTNDIVRTWRRPRAVMRDLLAQGKREDRAIAYLMISCFLIFVAQWPRLSREAFLTGQDFDTLLGGALMGWLFIMPLALYGL
ncbi:MAG: YIP1 family protein, partial [Paracoccaceae bacterium]|nr:YIP1 family protein [Paracoccaceae bacterium]